jgi:transposase
MRCAQTNQENNTVREKLKSGRLIGEDVLLSRGRSNTGALCPTRSLALGVSDTLIGEMLSIIPFRRLPFLQTPTSQHVLFVIHPNLEENMEKSTVIEGHSSTAVWPRQETIKGIPADLSVIKPNAAGIDIGSQQHYVAVPVGRDEMSVRAFDSFTSDLQALSDWLKRCGIETVAMEATGVYWIPLYDLLAAQGFEVYLVNARHVKNVSGRKSDVKDCQWLQKLHSYGLLSRAFRPEPMICRLRSYHRHREMLVQQASKHILHMQKALSQMNLQLHNVISDVTGLTGMRIIRAIMRGIQDPKELAQYRDKRCKNSKEVIEKSLQRNYQPEHLFALKQAVDLYDVYQNKIKECDEEIEKVLNELETQIEVKEGEIPVEKAGARSGNAPNFDLNTHLFHLTGVNLGSLPGISSYTAFKIITEVGLDMSRWETEKHFAAWLGLCPGTKVSGGKRLSGKRLPNANRAALAFRVAANTLWRSQTALGAFYRRIKARLGAEKAVTATAHKLAKLFYQLLKYGKNYIEKGQNYYEEKYRQRTVKNLQKRAKQLGFDLIAVPTTA